MPIEKIFGNAIDKIRSGLWLSVAALCLTGCVSPNLLGGGVDFSLSAAPGSQAVTAGQATTFAITVNQTSDLGPVVQLSVSGAPTGISAQFVNGSVTGAGTVFLSVLTSSATPPGVSQLTIAGSDTTGTQKITVMLTVNSPPPPPNFSVTATPGTQTTLAGGAVSYGVNVTANGGATVNLSVSNVPAGATASFDHNSVTGTSTATLTVSTATSLPAGTYPLTIIGANSSATQNIQVNLQIVPTDFSLSTDLQPVVANAGVTLTGTVTVGTVVGSPGSVHLSLAGGAPAGLTVSFSSTAVAPGNSATVTIAVSSSVIPADYQLQIQGADASGSESVVIDVAVVGSNPAAGFVLSATPPVLSVTAGGPGSYTLSVLTNGSPVPAVNVDVQGLPQGDSFQVNQVGPGVFTIIIFTDLNSSSSTSNIIISVSGPGGTQSLPVTLLISAVPPCC